MRANSSGHASYGESVRRVRDRSGRIAELWLAADKLLPEAKVAREDLARYERATADVLRAACATPRRLQIRPQL
jgi:hypothetical protein